MTSKEGGEKEEDSSILTDLLTSPSKLPVAEVFYSEGRRMNNIFFAEKGWGSTPCPHKIYFVWGGISYFFFFSFLKDFMEQQQRGFSDSTPRPGRDRLQKSAKSLLSTLQLMSISQISTQKYGSVYFDPF